MKRLTIGLIGLTLAAAAQAEMFKCTDAAGKVTYSQTRCAADAAPANLNVHRPTPEQVQAQAARVASDQQFIDENLARRREYLADVERQRQVEALENVRAAELAKIQAQRARAANNQAGATWLNALSNDATNVNQRIDAEMDRLRGVR